MISAQTLLLIFILFLPPTIGAAASPDNSVTLFTHGDTPLLSPTKEGTLEGPALDLFRCAMTRLERPFSVQRAPLSRARQIIAELDKAVWFPSAYRGDADRMAHSVGPAGSLDIYWYKSKVNQLDPNSEAFKQSAVVTTYKGSAMEGQLRRDGYAFKQGSADRSTLVFMLLNGEVDAFVAVDFRDRLPKETLQKLTDHASITIKDRVPTAFRVANLFYENDTAFTGKFRQAFGTCLSNAAPEK